MTDRDVVKAVGLIALTAALAIVFVAMMFTF
jgi:hypothetical protein